MAKTPKVWAAIIIFCAVAEIVAVTQCVCGVNYKLELNLCYWFTRRSRYDLRRFYLPRIGTEHLSSRPLQQESGLAPQ